MGVINDLWPSEITFKRLGSSCSPVLCMYMGGCQYFLWVYTEGRVIIHLSLFVTRCITVIIYQLWCGGVSGTAWTVIRYVYAIFFMGNRGDFYGVQK
jgi:hypothetical protein